MTLTDITASIEHLSDDDYTALLTWQAREENPRRDRKRVTDKSNAELITQLRDSGDLEPPAAVTVSPGTTITPDEIPKWVDPGTNHARMYTLGNVVRHNGRIWESITTTLNSWEPGTENGLTWRDITERFEEGHDPDAPKPFVSPTGAHDAYGIGDRVTFNGKTYRSTIAANVYSPDEYPAGWALEQ